MGLFTKKYNPDQILDLINQLPDEEKKALQLNTKGLSHLVKPKKSENDNKKAQETAKTVNETVK